MPDPTALTMVDAVPRKGPALSATSDMPAFKAALETEKPAVTQAETGGVDEKAKSSDKTVTEDAAEADAGKSSKAKADETPPAIKREITLERNRRRAAEEAAQKSQAELSKALDALAALTKQAKPEEKEVSRPQRANYDDPDAYDEALLAWRDQETTKRVRAEEAEQRVKDAEKAKFEATQKLWNDRREAFIKEHPDFEEVAERDDLEISMTMANAILASEDGPAITYWLGQNPDEASRIAKLSPIQAAKEIGKIEARLAQETEAEPEAIKKPFRKPNPITPVGQKSASSRKGPDEEDMNEYAARRQAELMKERRPFLNVK